MKLTLHPGDKWRPSHLALTLSRSNVEALLEHLDRGETTRALTRAGALAEGGKPEEPSIAIAAVEDEDHYPGGSREGRLFSPDRNHAGEQMDLLGNEGRPE